MLQELLLNLFGRVVDRVGPYAPFARPINASFCEQPTGTLIERPGYAISNIPYIFLGIWLLLQGTRLARLFGITSILIGTFSFIYDVTFTHAAQYFDWLGMFLFVLLLIGLNMMRLTKNRSQAVWSCVVLLGIYLPLAYVSDSGVLLFAAGVVFVVISEIYLFLSSHKSYKLNYWLIGFVLFVVGWAIWQLDSHHLWCDPSNLFNGRAIFHYFTTVTIFFLYQHYKWLRVSR